MLEKIQYFLSVADAAIKYKKAAYDHVEAKRKYHNAARKYMDDLPSERQGRSSLRFDADFKVETSTEYAEFIKKRSAANRAKHRLFKVIG